MLVNFSTFWITKNINTAAYIHKYFAVQDLTFQTVSRAHPSKFKETKDFVPVLYIIISLQTDFDIARSMVLWLAATTSCFSCASGWKRSLWFLMHFVFPKYFTLVLCNLHIVWHLSMSFSLQLHKNQCTSKSLLLMLRVLVVCLHYVHPRDCPGAALPYIRVPLSSVSQHCIGN